MNSKSDKNIKLDLISEAIEDLRNGKVIIVVDDEDRENEGDFVAVAEKTTPEMINFMTLHGRGLVCTPLSEEICEKLELHPMVGNNTDPKQTAFTVSVDLLGSGVTTGISASDRAKTILSLVDEKTKPWDLSRPGHIFPLIGKQGGVLRRPGHTEASIDLAKLAGYKAGGVIVEIMNPDGSMSRLPELIELAEKFDLKIISIKDLISYRLQNESLIKRIDETMVSTHYGDFNLITYKQTTSNQIHFALVKGDWNEKEEILVRVKSANSYYDLFTSLEEGEKPLFKETTELINKEGKGAIVLINNVMDSTQLLSKLEGFKAVLKDHKTHIKSSMDEKDYGIGAQIIKDLKINKIRLITRNQPVKRIGLNGYGLEITDFVALT
jgi:3,4-dihydroxy 2-butanone 4-phosphate synthase / GTP cyclohydrolase II